MSSQEKPLDFDFGVNFKSVPERSREEREERLERAKRILGFGVNFLDRALGGIFPNDLILLGAKTGIGKTALSALIALSNAQKGKRVHYFALEAEDKEIERRMKYNMLANIVYERAVDRRSVFARLNYLDWYAGRLEDLTARYEPLVEQLLSETFSNLRTFYRVRDFTAEKLERAFLSIQDQTDLIVLDHLHYVDSDDTNENRGFKVIIKKIRDIALEIGKPVIAVAHVRKGERRNPRLVPEIDDFHGTSDVPKIATKAIMLAPAHDQPTGIPYLWNTYMSPVKCRQEGSRTRYVGMMQFNANVGAYERPFVLGKLTDNGEKFEAIPDHELPHWAKERIESVAMDNLQ